MPSTTFLCKSVQMLAAGYAAVGYESTFQADGEFHPDTSTITEGMGPMTNSGYRFRTLIVDDDSSIIKLIAATLNRKMSDVLEVTSTLEPTYVWGMAASGQVDICVTDMNMPMINGFKLLKQLKELNPLTQVIFLTAHRRSKRRVPRSVWVQMTFWPNH